MPPSSRLQREQTSGHPDPAPRLPAPRLLKSLINKKSTWSTTSHHLHCHPYPLGSPGSLLTGATSPFQSVCTQHTEVRVYRSFSFKSSGSPKLSKVSTMAHKALPDLPPPPPAPPPPHYPPPCPLCSHRTDLPTFPRSGQAALPQGLCTGSCFLIECSSPRCPQGSLLYFTRAWLKRHLSERRLHPSI